MNQEPTHTDPTASALHDEVRRRFGVLPNFFRLASEAPEITANLWGFARFGYLDNPLPSLFKERLFVYLSRFCEVRYCIARHVGFLIGLGRPAGDERCPPQYVDQAVRLIRRRLPRGDDLAPLLAMLTALGSPLAESPGADSPTEEAVFACATHVFLQTPQAAKSLEALRLAFDAVTFQHLLVLLAFVRTAHFWTQVHPELEREEDIRTLLDVHEALAECVLKDPEAATCAATQTLLDELASLRRELALRQGVAPQEAQHQIAAALESITDGFLRLDRDWRVVYANAEAERVARRPREEMLGKSHWELWPATVGTHVEAEYRRALAEDVTVDFEHYSESWNRWLSVKAYPSPGGGLAIYFRDITDRKQADLERRQNEQRFRMLVEQVKDYAIFSIDLAGRPTTWNEGVRRVLGFEEAEFFGLDIAPTIFTPEDVQAGVPQRELEQAAANGSASDDRWMRRKDGTRFFAAGVTSALKDADGKLLGFTKVMRDTTERNRLEDELRQYAAELSEADRRKDEFLAMLAHELRNPLAPVRNAVEVLQRARDTGETLRPVVDMMQRQVGQMVRLIDDLLDVSRISRGKIELHRGRVELASVIHHAVEAARTLAQRHDQELTVTLPPRPIYLDADPTRLAQVVGNLLNNACKFSDRGSRIWLTVQREGEQAAIRVRDNGVGIDPGQLDRIFDMFTQIDTSLERAQSGLGIGLSLVKNLVEMHGGTVEVHSAGVGHGSEFVVRLPILAETAKPSPAQPAVSAAAPAAGRRILVVDDNRDSAESLAMLLQLTGNEMHIANDGLEAVQAAETFRPDVVLLDIGLPKLNGYEAAHRIREHPWGKHMVLVALTGWGQEEDRQKSRAAGFNAHLVKPLDHTALMKLLAELPS